MAKYTFTAVRRGRNIEETAYTFAELRAILERWLVWDEGCGYMRHAPSRVERDNGKSVDSSFLYAISSGRKSYKDLQQALSTKKGW
jgi:hypothetical protein